MSYEHDTTDRFLNAESFTKQQRQDYIGYIWQGTKQAAKILLPTLFHRKFDTGHEQIMELLDDSSIQFLNIIAPRGCGKTAIAQRAFALRCLLLRFTHYYVPIGVSLDNEVTQTENLKFEIRTNRIVRELFGDLEGDSFAKTEWETAPLLRRDGSTADFGSFVRPRGKGQEVRGFLYHEFRPDLILMDDIQKRDEAQNPAICHDDMQWLYGDVLGAVDAATTNWRIISIGTNLGPQSMVMQLSTIKQWHTINLSLCSDTLVSNFPNAMTDDGVKALAQRYEAVDMFDVFCREYMGLDVPTKGAAFTMDKFMHYSETDADFQKTVGRMFNFVIVDPAKTLGTASADTAITGGGFDPVLRRLYFRDCIAAKLTPDETYDTAIDMCLKLRSHIIAVEVTSLHEFVTKPIKDRIRTRNVAIELKELHARKYTDSLGIYGRSSAKVARATALAPYYRLKQVYHNREVAHLLEIPLLKFPKPPKWDVIDTWAYSTELLEQESLYMDPIIPEEQEKDNPYDSILDLDTEDIEIAHLFGGGSVRGPGMGFTNPERARYGN